MEEMIGTSEEQVSESSSVSKIEQILSYLRRNRVGHEYLVNEDERRVIAKEIGCNHDYVRQALKSLDRKGKIKCSVRKYGQGHVITFPDQIEQRADTPSASVVKAPKKSSASKRSDLTLQEIEERLNMEIHEMEIALEAKKNTLATVLKLRKELK